MAQTKKPIDGDDGLPAEEVGIWAKDKHAYLCAYIDISRKVRKKWCLSKGGAGSVYIDPFCGTGRCKIRGTNEWIDGGAIAAWKKSRAGGAPFTELYIGDINPQCREAMAKRLRNLGANVIEVENGALMAISKIVKSVNSQSLCFAFLDPYNIGSLDFEIIKKLSSLKRIDILVNLSQMDLKRNLQQYLKGDKTKLDIFSPGWREKIDINRNSQGIYEEIIGYWFDCIKKLGIWPSENMKLVRAPENKPLYQLLFASKNDTAEEFWNKISSILDGRIRLI